MEDTSQCDENSHDYFIVKRVETHSEDDLQKRNKVLTLFQ